MDADRRAGSEKQRMARGMLRVPFVRRCALAFEDGREVSAFIVNINVLGAYIAMDDQPVLGHRVSCTFRAPGKDTDLVLHGVVTWLNPRQQHPVHSLPPGFGLKLDPLEGEDRRPIEDVVEEYVARNPQAAR